MIDREMAENRRWANHCSRCETRDKRIEALARENKGLREEHAAQSKAFGDLEAGCCEFAGRYKAMIEERDAARAGLDAKDAEIKKLRHAVSLVLSGGDFMRSRVITSPLEEAICGWRATLEAALED